MGFFEEIFGAAIAGRGAVRGSPVGEMSEGHGVRPLRY